MKGILPVVVILTLAMCHAANDEFYPFDREFQFHNMMNVTEYDTVIGECGYWNLTKRERGLSVYYQFFENEREIVAKGFDLDLISIPAPDSLLQNQDHFLTLLKRYPVDYGALKNKLQMFGIKDVRPEHSEDDYMEVVLVDKHDSLYRASIVSYIDKDTLVRQLTYFNGRD